MKGSGIVGVVFTLGLVQCGGRSTRDDAARGSDDAGGGTTSSGGVSGSTNRGGVGGEAVGLGGLGGFAGVAALGGAAPGGGGQGGAPKRTCGALIDDMEDGTGRPCTGDGRIGVWYAYNDGQGVQWPAPTEPGAPILPTFIPNGRGESTRAMYSLHAYQVPAVEGAWGAGIGVDLAFDGTAYGSFDASAYDGITFWVRGSVNQSFMVRVSTVITTLVAYGGTCPNEFCNPHSLRLGSTPEWTRISVPFSVLAPTLSHDYVHGQFDKTKLTNIQFLFAEPSSPITADIWIDDLAFYAGPPPAP